MTRVDLEWVSQNMLPCWISLQLRSERCAAKEQPMSGRQSLRTKCHALPISFKNTALEESSTRWVFLCRATDSVGAYHYINFDGTGRLVSSKYGDWQKHAWSPSSLHPALCPAHSNLKPTLAASGSSNWLLTHWMMVMHEVHKCTGI